MSTGQTDPGQGGSDARRAALHTLDRLVGTWAVQSADSSGTVRYSWFEGDAFLVQEVDLVADGDVTRGVEYIGWDPESATLRSHYFAGSGEILEYTYDLTGATLTIWFGGPDSPAKFVGDFDAAFQQNTGAWEWPGGGYASTMRRIEEAAS
jgi:hypothetical protein